MAKSPYKPNQEELEGARKLVLYEMDMLHASVEISQDRTLWKRKRFGSIVRDSILLHVRNLLFNDNYSLT